MEKDTEKSDCCFKRKTLQTLCIGLTAVLGVCFIIAGILILLYFSQAVDAVIKSKLPLKRGSEVTEAWLAPPLKPLLRVYLFNVTNPDGFLKGQKPKLQEVGPFVYEEVWTKENVSWLNNGAEVEYAPVKTYFFRSDLSVGPESEKIMLPNIPMISALASLRYSDFFVRSALGSMLEILKQEAFGPLSVSDILWGYDHPLVKLAKDVLPPQRRFPFEEFGFFVGRNGTTAQGLLRAKTGIIDVNDIGQLVSFNGEDKLKFWKEGTCNDIKGSDGAIFHPNVLPNETLFVFAKDLCQSMPLVFDQEVSSNGLPGYRFVPPADVFNHSSRDPLNDCFCMAEEGCSNFPAGLFNMSACQFGSPVVMSWPHFFQADRVLLDAVEGLHPIKEKHQFFIDIQPTLGNGLRASAKSQINLLMTESPGLKQAEGLRDMVFPVLWIAEGIDEITDEDTVNLLKTAIFTPERAKNALYPTCFAVGSLMLIFAALCIGFKRFVGHDREVFHVKTGTVSHESTTNQRSYPRLNGNGSSVSPNGQSAHYSKKNHG